MKYPPGSFSKNFAWHGTGLRRLHASIRAGFGDKLAPVYRDKWRQNSGIGDSALELIPVNFFLHNRGSRISVDELVFQAIARPHTVRFDRLALYAFHLNRVGGPAARPAMWANEFVREKLWDHGLWVASALHDGSLDSFVADRMQATGPVRVKCRNNYRHLFELCDYWPSELAEINSGAQEWIASALYLAWDRHVLDGGKQEKKELLNVVSKDELHKLMGMPAAYVAAQAAASVNTYLDLGCVVRFASPLEAEVPSAPPKKGASKGPATDLDWLDQEESDEVIERHMVQVQQQKRDRKTAAKLKTLYKNECMICGARLQVAEEQYYSEAAHIRPLGKPHDGPDKPSNMLVLCPNHHLQFDRGVLRLRPKDGDYTVTSRVKNDPHHKKQIVLKHKLDAECVAWHRRWFRLKRA